MLRTLSGLRNVETLSILEEIPTYFYKLSEERRSRQKRVSYHRIVAIGMLDSDLQTDRVVASVFNFIVRNNMNILRMAFGRACVLHTHLSQAVLPKLSCYHVIGTNLWTRGFATEPSASIKDIRERKTVQVIWDKDMVSDV